MMTTQTSYALSWKGESETKGKTATLLHCESVQQSCTMCMNTAGRKSATCHVAFSLAMKHAAIFLPFTLLNLKSYKEKNGLQPDRIRCSCVAAAS